MCRPNRAWPITIPARIKKTGPTELHTTPTTTIIIITIQAFFYE
jgi:hypothetical protein